MLINVWTFFRLHYMPMKTFVVQNEMIFEKTENNKKEAGDSPFCEGTISAHF